MGLLSLLLLSITGYMLYQNEPVEAILSLVGTFALVYGFCLYLNLSTQYTISDKGSLQVKCGILYNKTFDIDRFTSIRKSNNLMSSPAPSLDRIELAYGKFDLLIISPKNKKQFAEDLLSINPKIENHLAE